MPHLDLYALESDLAGREEALIGGLTEAVVAVYGEWARPIAVVRLLGLPPGRWGIGGKPATQPPPSVTFGINEKALTRPDSATILAALSTAVTDTIATVIGEHLRAGITIDYVSQPEGHSATGGIVSA